MKFVMLIFMWLVTELISIDAQVLTESLIRRGRFDLEDDLLLSLVARQDLDNGEFADLFGRGNDDPSVEVLRRQRLQRLRNIERFSINYEQKDHNGKQSERNFDQRENNFSQRENNHKQQQANGAQLNDNARQQRDNQATREAIKGSKINECLEMAGGLCVMGGAVASAVGIHKLFNNPHDSLGLGVGLAGAAVAGAAGALTLASKTGIAQKCIGVACRLASAVRDHTTGGYRQKHVRPLARASVPLDRLVKRGLPISEVAQHVQVDTKHYLSDSLVRKNLFLRMRAGILDDVVWG